MRRVLAFLAEVLVIMSMAGPARAHIVQSGNLTVWSGGGKCVKVQSGITESPRSGYRIRVGAAVETEETLPYYGCNATWTRPANKIRLTFYLRVHKPSGTSICRQLGYWFKNAVTEDSIRIRGDYGLPCGHYTYSVRAVGQTYYNGAWRGGAVSSGGHDF